MLHMLRFLGIALLGGAIGAGATGVASLAAALPDGHSAAGVQVPADERTLAILAEEGLVLIAHDNGDDENDGESNDGEDQNGDKDEDGK